MLPTSDSATQGSGIPVSGPLLMDLQAQIKGMKKPAHWRYKPMSRGWVETNITFDASGGIGTGQAKANAPAAILAGICAPDLIVGDRIIGIRCRFLGTGLAGTAHLTLEKLDGSGGLAVPGNLAIVDPPAAWATYTLDMSGAPHTVLDLEAFFFAISMPLVNMALGVVGLQIDRL